MAEIKAIDIREAALDRISRLKVAGRPMASVRRVPLVAIQPDGLPCLSVIILSEKSAQDGNVTIPQFVDTLELGISLILMASGPDYLDGSLDGFAEDVKDVLFKDTSFLQLFEYVTQVSREYNYPRDGETYMAELRMRIYFTWRRRFEPLAVYPLTMVDVQGPSIPAIDMQIPLTGG
jgi:hypothetical protein